MIGETIINGTDIYSAYGAFISLDGYRTLVEWPSSKDVEFNDWAEMHGIEADLSALRFNSHEAEVSFGMQRDLSYISDFYAFLSSASILTCTFANVGIQNKDYRIIGMSSLDYALTFGEIRVRLADDDPMKDYEYSSPSVTYPLPASPFSLNGVPFSAYGVRALYGTLGSVAQRGALKQYLLRSVSTKNGSLYDENPAMWNPSQSKFIRGNNHPAPKNKAFEVNLKCALTAPTPVEFWRNYNAFLHDLTAANESAAVLERCKKVLTADSQNVECYYEGQTVDDFTVFSDALWVQFTFSMLVLSGLSESVMRLLAAESGILVITEDGKFIRV